jgi:hypothetical protein
LQIEMIACRLGAPFCSATSNRFQRDHEREKAERIGSNGLKRKRWPVLNQPSREPAQMDESKRSASRRLGDCIAETVGGLRSTERADEEDRESSQRDRSLCGSYHRSAPGHETRHEQDECDNQQNVNELADRVSAHDTEQPGDEQNDRDRVQHAASSLKSLARRVPRQLKRSQAEPYH